MRRILKFGALLVGAALALLLFPIADPSLLLSFVPPTQFFVDAVNGSDSNNGLSSGAAWRTISHAIAGVTIGSGGSVINAAAGTYTESLACAGNQPVVCVNKSGTSITQRLALQCSAEWSVPSGSGCLLRNSGTNGGVEVPANFVDVIGFDYSNPAAGFGMHVPTAGQNSVHFIHNYLHDMGQTSNAGCPLAGGILAYNTTDLWIIGNRISNFGLQSLAVKNGGSCNVSHGIYDGSPGSLVENNVVIQAVTYGIQIYNNPCGVVVSNNTVDQSGKGDLVIAGGACSPTGNISVLNNIFGAAPSGAIDLGTGGGSPCTGSSHIKIANTLIPPGTTLTGDALNGCTDISGTVTEAPTTTFSGYSATSTNNSYVLKAGSLASGGGVSPPGCVSTTPVTPCVPSLDFTGTVRSTPPSIGAYDSGGGGGGTGSGSLSPVSLSFATRVPLQGCSAPQTTTFTNVGTGNLTITAETLSAQSDFQFGGTGSCTVGQVLTPGQSCTISGKFCPSKIGNSLSANVAVSHTAPNSPQTVTFTGVGANPAPPTGLAITVQ